jgi:hypothetical protein
MPNHKDPLRDEILYKIHLLSERLEAALMERDDYKEKFLSLRRAHDLLQEEVQALKARSGQKTTAAPPTNMAVQNNEK